MVKRSKGSAQNNKGKDMNAKILKVMLTFHSDERSNVKVEDVAAELEVHPRNKTFRESWSFLKNTRKLIGNSKSGDGLALTKAGLEEAATPEYKQMMKELAITPKTNADHQERIKKYFKKSKSAIIFDSLNKYGSLSKNELAALVGQNPRSHGFFYSFKELQDKAYLEADPDYTGRTNKKFRLSDKAFKSKDDRPKKTNIDANVLEEEISKGHAQIESQKIGQRSKNIKIKEESIVKKNGQDCVEVKGSELEEENEMELVPVVSADCESDNGCHSSP